MLSYSNDTAQPFFLISGRASSSGSLIRALQWTDVVGDEGYVVSPLDRVLHRRHREPARTGPPAAKPCGDVLMKIPIQGSLEMRRMSRVHTFDLISRSKEHRHRSRRRIFSSQLPLQLPPQPLFHPTGPPSAFLSLIGGCVPGVWFVARVLRHPRSGAPQRRVETFYECMVPQRGEMPLAISVPPESFDLGAKYGLDFATALRSADTEHRQRAKKANGESSHISSAKVPENNPTC